MAYPDVPLPEEGLRVAEEQLQVDAGSLKPISGRLALLVRAKDVEVRDMLGIAYISMTRADGTAVAAAGCKEQHLENLKYDSGGDGKAHASGDWVLTREPRSATFHFEIDVDLLDRGTEGQGQVRWELR